MMTLIKLLLVREHPFNLKGGGTLVEQTILKARYALLLLQKIKIPLRHEAIKNILISKKNHRPIPPPPPPPLS